jgi:DNA-binding SARP family transcriptional activator
LLAPLVGRLRASRSVRLQPAPEALSVSLARGRVERAGQEQALTARELELVLFLAAHRRTCRSEEIVETLWDQREHANRSVLRVYVRRLRLKLGESAIVSVAGGYALSADSIIDLDVIERTMLPARSQEPLGDALRDRLEQQLETLTTQRSSVCDSRAWFVTIGARIDDLARELGMLLGRDALRRGAFAAVLAHTGRIIERDACDEPARELRIRTFLESGDRAAALRELRVYGNTLASELGAQPSSALSALVDETRTTSVAAFAATAPWRTAK